MLTTSFGNNPDKGHKRKATRVSRTAHEWNKEDVFFEVIGLVGGLMILVAGLIYLMGQMR